MKRLATYFLLAMSAAPLCAGQQIRRGDFRKEGGYLPSSAAAALPVIQTQQGRKMHLWLGSNATIGEGAFPNFNPPDLIGCEYPVNSNLEHLYGAGIWVGAIVDTSRSG